MTKNIIYKEVEEALDNLNDEGIFPKELREAFVKFGVESIEANRKGMEALTNFYIKNTKTDNKDIEDTEWKTYTGREDKKII